MKWLIRLVLSAVALLVTSFLLNSFPPDLARMTFGAGGSSNVSSSQIVHVGIAVLALSLVNSVVRPIVGLLSLPLRFATLGISSLIINAALFWGVGELTGGYHVTGVAGLLLGPIIMGMASGLLNFLVRD